MLDVAFVNTPVAKLSFSPSKVTLNDIVLLYPSLGRVCHPREAEVLPEVTGAIPASSLPHAIAPCSDTEKPLWLGKELLCFESSLYVELKLLCSGYQSVCC